MRDDDTTEVAHRQSPSTTTSVRLFNGLGGVELGVRHTGRKAMLFVRFRKLVIAGWWKAPGIPGQTPMDRFAADAAARRAEVRPKDDSEIAGISTSASVTHAAGVMAPDGTAQPVSEPPRGRPGIPGRFTRRTEPPAARPEAPVVQAEVVQPKDQVIEPESPAALAEGQNVMHRLWKRVSSSLKMGR